MIDVLILALIILTGVLSLVTFVTVRNAVRHESSDDELEQRMAEDFFKRFDENRDAVGRLSGQIDMMTRVNSQQFQGINNTLVVMQKGMTDSILTLQNETNKTLHSSISSMSASNEKKLDEIRGVVTQKLDKTLNERLDTSFKHVGEQMAQLYKSLGELQQLSSGVTSLNKTLSNVKARGNWGEVQLGRILEQTLAKGQYDENVITRRGSSDPVEFAIKLPGDNGDICYLPIDAKFPADIYNRIVEASENADEEGVKAGRKELNDRIRHEAAKISDKYIDPPYTSDYAVMYLPTEGLYAEVLSINGLSEECQRKRVMIAGPTTVMALLNTVAIGFRHMALNRKSEEIRRILEATRAQIDKLEETANTAQKRIDMASRATQEIYRRTSVMKRKMKGIGSMDQEQSEQILGIESREDPGFEEDDM